MNFIYTISSQRPHRRLITIELTLTEIDKDELVIKLPNWRPGRYELGNFAKNIQSFKITTSEVGNAVGFEKTDKSTWKINTKGIKNIKVTYNYYANQLDGGGCYTSEDQLYFNPVQCCVYVPELTKEQHKIELLIPDDWKIATGLKVDKRTLTASNYDELVDCPVLASPSIQHQQYLSGTIPFHVWIQGDYQPQWEQLLKDFKAFTDLQIKSMGEFPAADYHFIIQVLPYNFYHGVEHLNSTVLVLGPGNTLNDRINYKELLGVASHELYHCWNVKTIKPVGLLPYNYESENYSRSGFVYEGFTTYLGDAYLKRSGVFSQEEFFHELETRITKHMHNYGRFNMSVADASFDTWLDGYVAGIPNRKVSIYDEGSIIALMIDLIALNESKGKMRLDTVMLALYQDFGKNNIGYKNSDVRLMCTAVAGNSMNDIFENYVYRNADYFDMIVETLGWAGCRLTAIDSDKLFELYYGFKIIQGESSAKVTAVIPDSPADIATIAIGDEIISAFGEPIKNNLNELIMQHATDELTLELYSSYKKKTVVVKRDDKKYYSKYKIEENPTKTNNQKTVFEKWLKG